jgi:hypothetical protein
VLVDVEGGQAEGRVVLELGGESLLDDVIAALGVQVVEGVEVSLGEGGGRRRHESHPKEAAELVGPRPRSNLQSKIFSHQ